MGKWWQSAVIYQIYPRSFKDTNGDGIGDLAGIISKLDYLEKLGVTALWLCPVYRSPNDDNGYDISDYRQIMAEFGTLGQMEDLIKKAKQRGIKIVMDLVVNHTSDEHQWFIEAKNDPKSKYRDYYIWRDPKAGKEPTELKSVFGGSAWEYDEQSGQYYFHQFSRKQPDLNWENPAVRKEVYEMMNFWVAKGIGGFRMDVIDLIGKVPEKNITSNGPKLHEYLKEMHQNVLAETKLVTVGETWGATPDIAKLYSDPKQKELSMVFQFEHVQLDQFPNRPKWFTRPLSVVKLKEVITKWQVELADVGWNSLFWNNHDLPRAVSAFGDDGIYRVQSAKMLAIVLHLLKGTPYIYQGEEIGMTNLKFTDIAQIDDIESKNMYQEYKAKGYSNEELLQMISHKGRDNARTPMQWDATKNAGFSSAKPWLAVAPNYQTINVKAALADKESIFYTYQKLIAYRKSHEVISIGDYSLLETKAEVFAYVRSYEGQSVLVIANFSKNVQKVALPKYQIQTPFIANYDNSPRDLAQLELRPYEALAFEITDHL